MTRTRPSSLRATIGFVHWVLYNLPPDLSGLPEGFEGDAQERNDFGAEGYGGPMPPEGHGTHRYYFWLLALDGPRPAAGAGSLDAPGTH